MRAGLPRWVEVPAAAVGLLAMSPLLFVAAVAIGLESRGSVLFRQLRVGHRGRLFRLYKLRTMRPANGGPEVTSATDVRITRVGRVLRKLKIDELPSLWNVVRGDMALVGPRPEVPRCVDLQDRSWRVVLEARPGITDPVTLRLRNEEDLLASVPGDTEDWYRAHLVPYKLARYREYLAHRTAWSDLSVIFATLISVVIPSRTPPPSLEDIAAETTHPR